MISLRPKHIKNIPVEKHPQKKNAPIYVKDHIIFMYDDKTIALLHSNSELCAVIRLISIPKQKAELLVGHKNPITAMCISLGEPQFLCSCCPDTVIIWDISTIFVGGDRGANPEKFIVGVELGTIDFCTLNHKWLALGQDGQILIILLQFQTKDDGAQELIGVEEHAKFPSRQRTHLACFAPSHPNMLVVVDDNSFKILDVSSQQLIYQSPGFGTHAPTCCSFNEETSKLVIGTSKGQVHVFKVFDQGSCSPWNVISVDLCKTLAQTERDTNDADFGDRTNETGCIIFSAKLYAHREKYDEASSDGLELFESEESGNTLRSVLAPGYMLMVFSNQGITIFDCKSGDCLTHLHLTELVAGQTLALVEFGVLAGDSLDELKCIVKSSERGAGIKIISLECSDVNYQVPASDTSIIPKGPVKASSVLRRYTNMSLENSVYEPYDEKSSKRKTSSKTLLSSCYGKPTQQKMFVPIINDPKKSSPSNLKQKSPKSSILSTQLCDTNLVASYGPPKKCVQEVCVSETVLPICLAPSGDGHFLACSTSSSAICVLPFKSFDLGKSFTLISHDAMINALHFNLDSKWLISSSKDSTAKIWDWKNKKCILNIDKKKEFGEKNRPQKHGSNSNPDVIDASFYYMDQFLLVASGNCLDMYRHQLDDPKAKPGSSGLFRSKIVHTAQAPSQQITCFSAANQLHSYVALCGCSDRSVRVYDMNAEDFCVELADVHVRPPHRLRQVTGSACGAEMHDLFLTAALSDCVRLWDLRSARCVQKYSRHVMRAYETGIDVSPCARYVAVGSEDKAVFIYDTRRPEDYLGKLIIRGDVAMDVAFSPNKPLLAASTLNGYVVKFSA